MGIGVTIGGLLLLLLIAPAALFMRLLHRRRSSSRRLPVRPGGHDHAPQQPDAEGTAGGPVEVRLVSGDPDAARQVAQVLSRFFVSDEPRSYPTGTEGGGSRLHLTVDTRLAREAEPPARSWLADSRSQARRTHVGETV